MKFLLALVLFIFICSPAYTQVSSKWTLAYPHNITNRIYYDTSTVWASWDNGDTTIGIKALTVKMEAFKKKYKSLDDVPLKYIENMNYFEATVSSVGGCTMPCSNEFQPIMDKIVKQAIAKRNEWLAIYGEAIKEKETKGNK